MRIENLMKNVEHNEWDSIIVHVGINNPKDENAHKITNKTDENLTYFKARNPDTQVAFLSIFIGKDNPDLNKYGQEVNKLVK